jgi:hypothetical protein
MRSNLGGALDGVLCEYRVWPIRFAGGSAFGSGSFVTQGLAKTVTEDLIPCANPRPGMNLRKNPPQSRAMHAMTIERAAA